MSTNHLTSARLSRRIIASPKNIVQFAHIQGVGVGVAVGGGTLVAVDAADTVSVCVAVKVR